MKKLYLLLTLFAVMFTTAANAQERVIRIMQNGEILQEYAIDEVDSIVLANIIAAPTDVAASVSNRSVTVTWKAVSGATYNVYRSSDNVSFTLLASGVSGGKYVDQSPAIGSNYYKVVCRQGPDVSETSSAVRGIVKGDADNGIYFGVVGFNDESHMRPLYLLTSDSLDNVNAFIDNLESKKAAVLCYSVEQALNALKSAAIPGELSTVALVTFTGSLDRGSTMLNYDYDTASDYLTALKQRIDSETISDHKLEAYSVGLRGSDITSESDIADFQSMLSQLASADSNAVEVSSLAEADAKLQEIAEKLRPAVSRQTVSVKISSLAKGTRVRFTMDDADSADESELYAEGTFDYVTSGGQRTYKLTDVIYQGMTFGGSDTVIGEVDGVNIVFAFEDIVTADGALIDKESLCEWEEDSNTEWKKNSDWDVDVQPDVRGIGNSALIMFVTDCSSTFADNFDDVQTGAKNFAKTLVDSASSGGKTKTYTVNGVSFKMVDVQGGTFQMGKSADGNDATPVHSVTLSSYSIGETEVTQALWKAVMGSNPSTKQGDNLPVEQVSWYDCQTFITKLNQLTGKTFRLPTEAEWEFAAKGGTKSQGYTYSGSNTVDDVAWCWNNSSEKKHEVAAKSPNELGIYDMSGNVWEWCQDWYDDYSSSSQTNPTGPSSGYTRVYRGGSWDSDATRCRAAFRRYSTPTFTRYDIGLRLAL